VKGVLTPRQRREEGVGTILGERHHRFFATFGVDTQGVAGFVGM
jgi:hypothetical protein